MTITTVVAPSDSENDSSISCSLAGSFVERPRSSRAGAAGRSACTRPASPASPPSGLRITTRTLAAHAEVDLGHGRAPVAAAVQPAPHHLGARPGVEHLLGGGGVGALDAHARGRCPRSRVAPCAPPGTRRRRRTGAPSARAGSRSSPTPPRAPRGRSARRWVLPSITRLTTPASSSVFRCREIVGLDTPKSRVTSPDGRRAAAEPLHDVAAERMGERLERIVSHSANYIA